MNSDDDQVKKRIALPGLSPDEDAWIVIRLRPRKSFVLVAIEEIEKLPDDPEWEAFERRVAEHTSKRVPAFEE